MDYTEFIGKFTRTIDLVNMTRWVTCVNNHICLLDLILNYMRI